MSDYAYSPDAPKSKYRRVYFINPQGKKRAIWAIPCKPQEGAKLLGFYKVDDEGNFREYVKKEGGKEVIVTEKTLFLIPAKDVVEVKYAEISLLYGWLEIVPEPK
jgi:hypothetical protein